MENLFLQLRLMVTQNNATLTHAKGAIGCFEEACRNVMYVLVQNPLECLDHLQFGNPNDPEIFLDIS